MVGMQGNKLMDNVVVTFSGMVAAIVFVGCAADVTPILSSAAI